MIEGLSKLWSNYQSGPTEVLNVMNHSPKVRRFDSIQILRALAAWTVVYHHYIQIYGNNFTKFVGDGLWKYGVFGVDVFFLISGFIMYESVRNRPQSAAHFIKRRITRIVPNYWFYTVLLVACCLILPGVFARSMPFTLGSITKSLFFIPHLNPSGIGEYPFHTVGWTLNYEMFFYMVFAACMLLPRRYTAAAAVALLLLPKIVPQALPQFMAVLGPFGPLLPGHYLGEFAMGICIGCFHGMRDPNGKWARWSGVAICFCSLAFLFSDLRRDFAAAGMLWGALCFKISSNGPIVRAAKHLGNISYSTYLCHGILITAALGVTGKPAGPWAELSIIAVITFLTLVLSELSYRLIERGRLKNSFFRSVAHFGQHRTASCDQQAGVCNPSPEH